MSEQHQQHQQQHSNSGAAAPCISRIAAYAAAATYTFCYANESAEKTRYCYVVCDDDMDARMHAERLCPMQMSLAEIWDTNGKRVALREKATNPAWELFAQRAIAAGRAAKEQVRLRKDRTGKVHEAVVIRGV